MDSPLHSRVKLAVSWVDSSRWKPSKVTKDANMSKQGFSLCIWGDAQYILFIDYLEKGRTINTKYYMALLVHLKEEIVEKTAQMKKKCSFTKTMHRVTSWLQQWQDYINCTSNCFCTHPILQIWPLVITGCLQTSKKCSTEEVISETEVYFEAKDKLFYKKGIELLEKCWNQSPKVIHYVDE